VGAVLGRFGLAFWWKCLVDFDSDGIADVAVGEGGSSRAQQQMLSTVEEDDWIYVSSGVHSWWTMENRQRFA
jgi:hypothetical protein